MLWDISARETEILIYRCQHRMSMTLSKTLFFESIFDNWRTRINTGFTNNMGKFGKFVASTMDIGSGKVTINF